MKNRRLATVLMAVAVSAGALGACGSSSQSSAAAQVCTDRSNLHKAIDAVVTDLKDLNVGKAKDGLSNVNDAFNALKKSASELKSEEAKALTPQIDQLKSDLQDLKNVRSLSDFQAGWTKVTDQFQSISSQVTDTLKCPS
jgi:predicted  nucleic acid-binding Zn-ribbon protein